jgi:hypothetical protein
LYYQSESDVTIASVSSFDVDAEVLASAVAAVHTFVFVVAQKFVSHINLIEKLEHET